MSSAFQRFKYSFFEDPTSARDALDVSSLIALEGDERTRAETMLLELLPDTRAVIGLGALRSKMAEPELRRLFNSERALQLEAQHDVKMQAGGPNEWYPSAMLHLAHALWQINPDPSWPQASMDGLTSARDWVFRQEAVQALFGVDESEAVAALTQALDDDEPVVRYAAARGLLLLHGLPALSFDLQNMMVRVTSEEAARHDSGKHEILAAIAGRAMVGQ